MAAKENKMEKQTQTKAAATDTTAARKTRRVLQGVVVSNKMDKSAVVAITSQVRHPQYGKFVRRTEKYVAHDETNQCTVGDVVKICETRPLSRTKRWRIQQVITKAV